ncbi:MAG: aminotransferase class III-fold pyridoxal phosphate-dependent enzyme [Candidatus Marinimicrobia bacterium]|nr:aminotransferase class III-fold pyridoxal phosphate-dependent enzyme [Candidatus Neomarinimicrobiota bacterium]MCF7828752.1 aminotransferase class III-fold pyridoxal phosphate-dependent enzyme [Candidatus Neomarinimicrobiota bacterium]MCF7880669.1 aminotransferase class III-fold pyridoxal phosphate-dependent enzyme [Candidatus Neomarinimicrobiota bacterium]
MKTSGTGQNLWKNAKDIIPGGNQLLSKRSEMFLPGLWPSYYKKAAGCEVWDMDGNHFYDFAQMGVGSCILGYADGDVNSAVASAISNGSMSTLNCPEEVQLAEKLIELHPWAEMVRFSRTGGEACAIATRIARAASGKDKIAFCGYHGWHDWYLASNLADDSNLDGQLLPGLQPKGVPKGLKGSAIPFHYNSLDELQSIIDRNPGEIGVIYLEPQRGTPPEEGFLEGVRGIADNNNAVLIFDEVTSGFRMNPGGIHLKYNVNPDMAVFGKALGNGYPISTVIGKRDVMDAAQDTFISSTFWTERIGPTAALATIDKYISNSVHEKLIEYGERINSGWQDIAENNALNISVSGISPLTHIHFDCYDPPAAQTYYTQEMLKKGYLVGAAVYTTYAYSTDIINQFLEASSDVFTELAKLIQEEKIEEKLMFEKKHSGFARLA